MAAQCSGQACFGAFERRNFCISRRVVDKPAAPAYYRRHLRARTGRRRNDRVFALVSFPEHSSKYEVLFMPPTTVEPKVSLEPQHRDWLTKIAAVLQVKLSGTAPQAGGTADDADLVAKCKQIKAAVVPKVKDAVAADPS